MGQRVITRRYVGWVTESRLELTNADYEKRRKRKEKRQNEEYDPVLFPWHYAILRRLDKCPYCGETPYLSATWRPDKGYDYKIQCPNDCATINCGDWYGQLSRAGLDWNYRAREAAGAPHKHCPHWKGG